MDDLTQSDRKGLATEVRNQWNRAGDALMESRANYWLNMSFYLGHQWVWWDRHRRTVQSATSRTADTDRVRAKVNLIRPRINSLKGRLTTRPLSFEVRPTAADDATLQAATIGEHILEARRMDDNWEEIRVDTVFSLLMGATTLVMPDWDTARDDAFVESFNIAEFTLEPGTRRPRDARWMILSRALPPGQIKDRYNLDFMPKADSAMEASPLQRKLMFDQGLNDSTDLGIIYQFFQRPDERRNKKGRVATVVDDEVVEYEDWPYPFEHLPGYVFRADIVPQRWYGDTPMNDARSVQAAYNQTRSTMLEHIKKAANSRLLVPMGSGLDDFDFTDESGEVVPYMPDSTGAKPSWMEAPTGSRDLRFESELLEQELDNILFTHAVTRGQAPGDRNSGLALSILAEKDDTPLGTFARDQQQGWSSIATQILKMYAAKVTEPRAARVGGSGPTPPVTIQWTGDMIAGQTDVLVPVDAVMPHSRVAMQAMLKDLKQAFPEQFEGMDRSTFFKLTDLPNLGLMRASMDADIAAAVYENTLMAQGEIVIPQTFENHATHMAEHNRYRKSDRYRLADPDVQGVMDDHIMAHEQLIAEEVAHQRTLNEMMPGLAAMPQGNEPAGSLMPPDHISGPAGAPAALPAGPRPQF